MGGTMRRTHFPDADACNYKGRDARPPEPALGVKAYFGQQSPTGDRDSPNNHPTPRTIEMRRR
jgi:hypothetical protein